MKQKNTLAALSGILMILANPAMAELTHINGVPVPPIQTIEQARAETEKRLAAIQAQEAKASAVSDIANNTIFYTGKPYLESTGTYAFLFRNYDPELSRWTSADPSGFPDGPNAFSYVKSPVSQLDFGGLFSLSITTPSPSTAYDPSGNYYAEAYNISHIGVSSGMQGTLKGLLDQYYSNFSTTISSQNLPGTVNIQKYAALNKDRDNNSRGALELRVMFAQAPEDFSWIQLVRMKLHSGAEWSHWIIDTTEFGAPSYNSSGDPGLYDLPTLGGWTYNGQVSGATKEFYTFATIKTQDSITIYDAFYWGGIIKELKE